MEKQLPAGDCSRNITPRTHCIPNLCVGAIIAKGSQKTLGISINNVAKYEFIS